MGRGPSWSVEDWEELRHRLSAGQSCARIAAETQWPLSSVKKAAAKARRGVEAEERHKYAGSSKLFQEEENAVMDLAASSPELSNKQIHQRLGLACSMNTVKRITASNFHCVRKVKRQLLTQKQIQGRLQWCKLMARRILAGRGVRVKAKVRPLRVQNVVFSDEKLFRVRAPINKQNRQIRLPKNVKKKDAQKMPDYSKHLRVEHTQSNPGVMVGMLFSGTYGCSPPIVIEPGVKINASVYQELVATHYMPWILSKHREDQCVLQEDNAPSHSAKSTGKFFATQWPNLERLSWPANSPDLNPLDFTLWARMQAAMPDVCENRAVCLIKVHEGFDKIQRELADGGTAKINAEFERRIFACLAAEGAYFES